MTTFKQVEKKISQAFDYMGSIGYMVDTDAYHFPDHQNKTIGCIGAILMMEDEPILHDNSDVCSEEVAQENCDSNITRAAEILGISFQQMCDFTIEFDGFGYDSDEFDSSMVAMAKRIKKHKNVKLNSRFRY